MTEKLSTCVRHLFKETPLTLEDFKITAFEVPHDGTDNVGYCIELNRTFGGTWYVLLGSAVAFLAAAVVNNFMHFIALGLFKKRDGLVAFAVSGVISTALGQFVDNLVFALLVSHLFFGWTLVQCVSCALAGVVIELLCELLFLGLGHRVCRAWKERGVGEAYFRLCQQNGRERE